MGSIQYRLARQRQRILSFGQRVWHHLRCLLGLHLSNPDKMEYPVVLMLIILSTGLGVALLASNLAAIKVWNLFGIPVDGGIWLFPVTYVLGDLLVEIYGEKVANVVALCCTGFMMIAIAILCGIELLPSFPGVDNSAYTVLRQGIGRTSLASALAFLCSQIVNNRIFVRIRVADVQVRDCLDDTERFLHRSIISSIVAHLSDSLVFETLAFWGRVSVPDFISQAGFAYLIGVVLEFPLSKLTSLLIKRKLHNLHYTDGKIQP